MNDEGVSKLTQTDIKYQNERGFALIAVLMIIILMSAMATGFLLSTTLESKLAFSEHDKIISEYLSETGIAWAVNRVRHGNWLEDVDLNHNGLYRRSDGDIVGYYLHLDGDPAFPDADKPELIWDYWFNDTSATNTPVESERNDLPLDSAFTVWGYQDAAQRGTNKWSLISIGYRENISNTTKATFELINPLLFYAVAGDMYVALHGYGHNTLVEGGIWSNGELEVGDGVAVSVQLLGFDGFSGSDPQTQINDDQYVAALGHVTFGGLLQGVGVVPTPTRDVTLYASSADNSQPDGFGLDNKTTSHPGWGFIDRKLQFRNGIERKIDYFHKEDKYFSNIFSIAHIPASGLPTGTTRRFNPICRDKTNTDNYYSYMDILTELECVTATPVGTIPTATPFPGSTTPTPTPTVTATVSPTGTIPTTFTPTPGAGTPATPTPTPSGQREWYNINGYQMYCAVAERACGTANAIGFLPCVPAPYPAHGCNAVNYDASFANVLPDTSPPEDIWADPPEGKFLLRKPFGTDRSTVNFELFRKMAREQSAETKRTNGTYFTSWSEFSTYINASAGSYDLVIPASVGAPTNPKPGWITIGAPEGSIFFIDDDPTDPAGCFDTQDHNIFIRGGIVTTGCFDLRDWVHANSRVRRLDMGKRVTAEHENPPIPPDFNVSDGAREVEINVMNFQYPAILAKERIWIVQRSFPTSIRGLVLAPYFDGYTTVSNAPKIFIDNEFYNTASDNGKVSIEGAVIGMIVELNNEYIVRYNPAVRNFIGWFDRSSLYVNMLSVEKHYHYEEIYYPTPTAVPTP